MLHFRFSTVLKECFQATVKRPFPCRTQESWYPAPRHHRCLGSVPSDAAAAAPRRTAPCAAPRRSYCVKTEGASTVELDEHLKKDGAEGDKYVCWVFSLPEEEGYVSGEGSYAGVTVSHDAHERMRRPFTA